MSEAASARGLEALMMWQRNKNLVAMTFFAVGGAIVLGGLSYGALWGGAQLQFRALAWLGCALILPALSAVVAAVYFPVHGSTSTYLYANGIVHQHNKRIEAVTWPEVRRAARGQGEDEEFRPARARLHRVVTANGGRIEVEPKPHNGDPSPHAPREERATVVTGAPRVLTVEGSTARQLLAATDEADPDGRWAMAAQVLTSIDPSDPPLIALDTRRLAAVGNWRPEFGASAAQLAVSLAPQATEAMAPLRLTGTTVSVDVELSQDKLVDFGPPQVTPPPAKLDLNFVTDDGGQAVAELTDLPLGRRTVTAKPLRLRRRLPPGRPGRTGLQYDVAVHLYAVRQLDPPADVVSPDEFLDAGRWRGDASTLVGSSGGSLTMRSVIKAVGQTGSLHVGVLGMPTPVPVAVTADLRPGLTCATGRR